METVAKKAESHESRGVENLDLYPRHKKMDWSTEAGVLELLQLTKQGMNFLLF
jgi:hypothetical protein